MCQKCGCNTCESIRGPLLTEGKVQVKSLLSENLQHHVDKNIPLFESVFRIGSNAHLNLIREARKMYSRDIIDLCEEDEELIKTHLGEFAIYEGESVPLDLPMLNEFALPKFNVVKPIIDQFLGGVEKAGKKLLEVVKREGKQTLVLVKEIVEYVIIGEKPNPAEEKKINKQLLDLGFLALLGITGNIPVSIVGILYWILQESGVAKEFLKLDENILTEKKAKKKKKDPQIGKPKRGGPKAYYVYVRDPKTKKIKKVTFGSGGLKAKIRNPKARKAFAARHRCKTANDSTTARYWACRLPRYASMLGLGANMNTFW